MSIDYYDRFADAFVEATLSLDMHSLYRRFEPLLKPGALILDAGCGSGRDSLHFLQHGFHVVAMDASIEMVKRARMLTGLPVHHCRFESFRHIQPFDAIWACASLLHVPADQLTDVMGHLLHQLRTGGIFYCSFKYGAGELTRDGRCFTLMDETGLQYLLNKLPTALIDSWQSPDLRPGHEEEKWLNLLLRKQ